MCFSLKCCDFFWTLQVLLLQCWCLTCHCVHSLTPRGNRERPESAIYLKILEKKQYLMNNLYQTSHIFVRHPTKYLYSYTNRTLTRTFYISVQSYIGHSFTRTLSCTHVLITYLCTELPTVHLFLLPLHLLATGRRRQRSCHFRGKITAIFWCWIIIGSWKGIWWINVFLVKNFILFKSCF